VLANYRPIKWIETPATLDGGDVLRLGRVLCVGRSSRTNEQGVAQLRSLVEAFGYRVEPVDFEGCLHLKSAVTAVSNELVVLNPAWVSADAFPAHEALWVDTREPHAANALRIGNTVVYSSRYPRTLERLLGRGLRVVTTDCSELAKAEGAVTCCSLVFPLSV
jgi:dimethylargininase